MQIYSSYLWDMTLAKTLGGRDEEVVAGGDRAKGKGRKAPGRLTGSVGLALENWSGFHVGALIGFWTKGVRLRSSSPSKRPDFSLREPLAIENLWKSLRPGLPRLGIGLERLGLEP